MNDKYEQQVVRWATTELLMIQNFKRYVRGKVNEGLTMFNVDSLPSILYVLSRGAASEYIIDSVRLTPDFIERVIDGYERDIVAYSYAHRLFDYDQNGEETKKVSIYYEDNLVRITNYHTPAYSVLTDSDVIKDTPDYSVYNEYHPAMINLSNLLSIN